MSWAEQVALHSSEPLGIAPPPMVTAIGKAMNALGVAVAVDDQDAFNQAALEQANLLKALFGRRPPRDVEELVELAPWWKDCCD